MKEKQIVAGLLFICCAGIVALLVFKGFNKANKQLSKQEVTTKFTADFENIISEAKKKLSDIERAGLNEVGQKALAADTVTAFEASRTLIQFWDSLQRFDIAGYYYTRMYDKNPSEFNLMNASQRYYEYSTTAADSVAAVFFLKKASEGFKKVLDKNPNNLDAKVLMAMCTVTDRSRVMEAIPMLKGVLAIDSNHIMANYTLGRLQIESGQLEKALLSFQKLVSLQPSKGEFHFYLAEVQQKMGNKNSALIHYETAKILMPDQASKQGIEEIIKNLKSK